MVVLVIGPSGIGKSDYGRHAARTMSSCEFADLDDLVSKLTGERASQLLPRIGNDEFLVRCQQALDPVMASRTSEVTIVAVGAGALQSRNTAAWIRGFPGLTLALRDTCERVYARGGRRNDARTLADFVATEYNDARNATYASAKHECDVTGLTLEDARSKFTETVRFLASTRHATA